MSKMGLWAVAAIAVLTFLYLVYLAATFEAPTGTTTVIVPASSEQPTAEPEPIVMPSLPQTRIEPRVEPAPAAAEPVIVEAPVEVEVLPEPVVEPTEVVQLPSLNDSDEFVFESLRALSNGAAIIAMLTDEQLVRSLVVFVENINRGEFPQTGLPYKRINQEMPVRNIDENLFVMDESAHARFDQIVDTFVAVDTAQAMVIYRTLQPLFQQAYAEIGNRNVDFSDTLRSAINRVLRSPTMEGPYQLVKPSVMYLYADANIENMAEVQKQLIRIGPENTQKLKDKLRQFAEQL